MSEDTKYNKHNLDPEEFGGSDFPDWDEVEKINSQLSEERVRHFTVAPRSMTEPLLTPEEAEIIKNFINDNYKNSYTEGNYLFNKDEPWIQTYSGRRFTPTNPYADAIVIQDIAHALSMQCRFSGHVKKFYSVAQHCVLVSYLCDQADALWGLLHDASEAYLVDVPSPLKKSGKFDSYLEFEDKMQKTICKRFNLSETEPESVKRADKMLLSTEARDLLAPLHCDWVNPAEPIPFKIEPLSQQDAKDLFMKRFFELTNHTGGYEHYLKTDNRN